MDVTSYPHIIAYTGDFLGNHALKAHGLVEVGGVVIDVEDKAIGTHHDVVADYCAVGDMGVDADARIIAYLNVDTRGKVGFALDVDIPATFLENALAKGVSRLASDIEE